MIISNEYDRYSEVVVVFAVYFYNSVQYSENIFFYFRKIYTVTPGACV